MTTVQDLAEHMTAHASREDVQACLRVLDTLSERTGRARGVYLRMAVSAMLPLLEAHHWHQQTAAYESRIFEEEFLRLTSQLIEEHPRPEHKEDPT